MAPDDDRTRAILEAARRTIAEKGFAGTTISQGAARAGVSRGLLHYYFESKEDLLARVVRSNVQATVAMVEAMFARAGDARQLAAALTGGLREVVEQHPDFFHVFFESWAIARQSERVSRELEALYRQFRGAIQAGLAEAVRRGVIDRRRHPSLEGLAAVLTGLIDGLGLQLVTEPELARRREIWDACRAAVERALG